MSSIKCPNCGLTNFATTTECKRCKQSLGAPSYPYWNANGPVEPPKPDWSRLQTVPAVPGETVTFADYDGRHTVGNILFAIYMVLKMLGMFYSLSDLTHISDETWKLATNPKSKLYLASFEPMYYLVLSWLVVFMPAALTLLFTLFRKSKVFIRLVVLYLAAEFVLLVLTIWFMFKLETELREKNVPQLELVANHVEWFPYLSMVGLLIMFIWFRYYTTSKRARLVFQ